MKNPEFTLDWYKSLIKSNIKWWMGFVSVKQVEGTFLFNVDIKLNWIGKLLFDERSLKQKLYKYGNQMLIWHITTNI